MRVKVFVSLTHSLSPDKGYESAARCRVYRRDEHKISVIFEMMKKKCIKSDSEKTTSVIPSTTPDDIPPNTTVVNVPYNSLPVSFR